MPKLYEYLGIVIFFYSNEHLPIHVHGKCGSRESKAEFILNNGKIIDIKIYPKTQGNGLEGDKLKDFSKLVHYYADEIVEK